MSRIPTPKRNQKKRDWQDGTKCGIRCLVCVAWGINQHNTLTDFAGWESNTADPQRPKAQLLGEAKFPGGQSEGAPDRQCKVDQENRSKEDRECREKRPQTTQEAMPGWILKSWDGRARWFVWDLDGLRSFFRYYYFLFFIFDFFNFLLWAFWIFEFWILFSAPRERTRDFSASWPLTVRKQAGRAGFIIFCVEGTHRALIATA